MNCLSTKQRSGALHLTQRVDYGMILLTHLANETAPCSIKTISKENLLAFPFMQKIAGLLQNAKIIKAKKGKYGGYVLIKKPEEITVKEVIEALEGKIGLVPCLVEGGKQVCVRQHICKIRPGFQKLNAELHRNVLTQPLTAFIS